MSKALFVALVLLLIVAAVCGPVMAEEDPAEYASGITVNSSAMKTSVLIYAAAGVVLGLTVFGLMGGGRVLKRIFAILSGR